MQLSSRVQIKQLPFTLSHFNTSQGLIVITWDNFNTIPFQQLLLPNGQSTKAFWAQVIATYISSRKMTSNLINKPIPWIIHSKHGTIVLLLNGSGTLKLWHVCLLLWIQQISVISVLQNLLFLDFLRQCCCQIFKGYVCHIKLWNVTRLFSNGHTKDKYMN